MAKATENTQPPAQEAVEAKPWWRSNLTMRILVAAPVLVIVFLLATMAPPIAVAAAVMLTGCYGMYEFLQLTKIDFSLPKGRWILVLSGGLPAVGAFVGGTAGGAAGGIGGLSLGLAGIMALSFATLLFPDGDPPNPPGERRFGALEGAGVAILGGLLVPWSLSHLVLMALLPQGRGLIVMLILALTLSDTLAYFVGKTMGRHLLWPRVSPKKTVEGAIAGLIGGIAGAELVSPWLTGGFLGFSVVTLAALGAGISLVGQIGDFVESRIKRLCDADDSGTLLPGHGGLLDRIDGYMLATPLLYYTVIIMRM